QVEVRHVRAVAVEKDDLLEAMVGQRFGDIEHVMHEVFEIVVDGPREIHDVARVAISNHGQYKQLIGDKPAGAVGDATGTDEIDVQRQMRPMLLDGAAGHQADLAQLDGVVDLGPSEFFVAIFGGGATGHGKISLFTFSAAVVPRTARARNGKQIV